MKIEMDNLLMAYQILLRYVMLYGSLDEAIIVSKAKEEMDKVIQIALIATENAL